MARPRSDIQPRIVAAARARFLAEGVEGASLREIARDAGTNIGMVVYYFPTKDELFLSVVETVYAKMVRDLSVILRADAAARARLRGAFVRLGTASDLELEILQLVARESLSSSARLRKVVARFMRGHVPLILATIKEGVQAGEFDSSIPVPFIFLAALGLGPLPQLARRAARALPIFAALPDAERLADLSIEVLLRAVGRRAAATKEKAPATGVVKGARRRRSGGAEPA